jgi:hypothetical protein
MARLTNPTTSQPMGRSRITSPSKDSVTDNGTALISIVDGEQIQITITLNWMTSLAGATIFAKVVEGNNDGAGTIPLTAQVGGIVTTLPIIDSNTADNTFILVLPETLIDGWSVQPNADSPVYGFIGLEVDDGGVGDARQVWKPMRGLVEVLYSPSEAV